MNDEPYYWVRKDGGIGIGRGEIDSPDLVLAGAPTEIAGFVCAGAPLGGIRAQGNIDLPKRLPSFFPMPEKAPPLLEAHRGTA